MDLQEILDSAVAKMRADKLKNSPQLTLGELIAKLEPIAEKQEEIKIKYGHEAEVRFDFECLQPTGINSWRGSYAELALSFDGEKGFTISEFLKLLKETIGKEFTGYKGGEFTMGKGTPIWVANYGNSGDTGLVGVRDEEYEVVLETAKCEF